MNFKYMPELNGRYDCYALMFVVAVVCVLLYRYLKKVHWLSATSRNAVPRRAAAQPSPAIGGGNTARQATRSGPRG